MCKCKNLQNLCQKCTLLVLSLSMYHVGIYKEDFTLFDTSRVWVFDNMFVFAIVHVYIPCKNFHTEVKSS